MCARLEQAPREIGSTRYFVLDLKDDQKLDIAEFFRLGHIVIDIEEAELLSLKYISIDDSLFIFDEGKYHDQVYDSLRSSGIEGELQSGGRITAIELGNESEIQLHDYSDTLVKKGLSAEASDEYKFNVIAKKLEGQVKVS